MTAMKPHDNAPDWAGDSTLGRVEACRMFLRIHDFLSAGESARVAGRVKKWAARHGVSLKCPANGDRIGPDDRPIS